jgi:ER-bound oxygenase mpaB/B'/Rubber oxygenase, catalytic domain
LLYDASDPALSAWVHDSLTDSFLTAYRAYGARPCSPADADRYVREQVRVGELLGTDPLPDTAAALSAWVTGHPDLAPSPAAAQAIRFLRRPPLPPAIRAAYRVLLRAAAATLPGRIGQIVGVPSRPGDLGVGRAAVTALRWSLGSSPDWRLALVRTGSSPPPGRGSASGCPATTPQAPSRPGLDPRFGRFPDSRAGWLSPAAAGPPAPLGRGQRSTSPAMRDARPGAGRPPARSRRHWGTHGSDTCAGRPGTALGRPRSMSLGGVLSM